MNNAFNPDSSFWKWFSKIADVLVLSLLWALCCLPVLTIAPSCMALYDTVARCIYGNEERPYKHFFGVLKAELLRGIGISVLWGVIGFGLLMGYNVLAQIGKTNSFVAVYATVYLATMLIPVAIFAWLVPIETRFSHTFFSLHKTAATFALMHLPTTGIMLGILAVAVAVSVFIPILVLILPGIVVTLQCRFIEKVFSRYIPEEQEGNTDDTAV